MYFLTASVDEFCHQGKSGGIAEHSVNAGVGKINPENRKIKCDKTN